MSINFAAFAASLLPDAERLVASWLPNGKRRGHEWMVGSLNGEAGDSLSINLRTGKWADFAGKDKGGDLLSLYAAVRGLSQLEAARELGAEDDRPQPAPERKPAVIEPQPVLVAPPVGVVVPQQPVYLWVPPGHRKHWSKHCYRYNACGVPVYFVGVGEALEDLETFRADEFAQARETRFGLEGLAGRMVHVPGARHALDDVLAMFGDVHLHATANAHAARTLRALVHPRQRLLQARVGRQQRDAPDEVLRCVHGNLLGVCGHDGAYTIS